MHFRFFIVVASLIWTSCVGWSGDAADVEESSAGSGEVVEATPQPSTSLPAAAEVLASGLPKPLPITSPLPQSVVQADDGEQVPWDYSPYQVLVWLVSEDPAVNAKSIEKPLRAFLDRDFAAVWRLNLADAPAAVRTAALRDIGSLSYDTITSADPVLAVKRDHREAVRIRIAKNVGEFVEKIYSTEGLIEEVKARGAAMDNASVDGVVPRLEAIDGDAIEVRDLWADDTTEALLVSRGMAMTLTEPEAKLITPPIIDLVGKAVEAYDKIFVVRVSGDALPNQIDVVEFDTLMRHFGPVASVQNTAPGSLPTSIGRGIIKAFAPVIRVENAGQKSAVGLLRAGGLILDENSPAGARPNDVFEPMTRKNDRNGKPIIIGPIDWAFLLVTEPEIAVLRAVEEAGFKIGDHVVSVSGESIENPQRIEKALHQHNPGEKLLVEVERAGGSKELAIDLSESSPPLQLQYLGFTAGERRGQVIVASVISDAPAEGALKVGDVVVSVGGFKVESINSLGRLIISTKADQPTKLSVLRGEVTQEVELMPTDISARRRKKDRNINMDYYAGRAGGLQGRKNSRTFRTALKVRAFGESTVLRLHLQREPDFPLIGYELYEKELASTKMTFIGRTDWDGRLVIGRTEDPFRLLYVKNGGAVLARLPLTPGLKPKEVADLAGDDMRLQAEAYIRGVQNAIIDLVAIRELFKARIRIRLRKGEMEKAETLMYALREQPSNEKLATDMGKKQAAFLKALGTRNANQRRKVDEMFTTTRELLTKHINPQLVRELEGDLIAAKNNGGKLPPEREEKSKEEDAER